MLADFPADRGETSSRPAAALVERLVAADIAEVPGIVQELDGYRRWADPLLRQEDAKAAKGSNKKLHLDLALLPVDEGKIAELRDELPLVSPSQFPVVAGRSVALQGRAWSSRCGRWPWTRSEKTAAVSSGLCVGDLRTRRPAMEPDQHLCGWSSGDAGGVGARGM